MEDEEEVRITKVIEGPRLGWDDPEKWKGAGEEALLLEDQSPGCFAKQEWHW